MHRFPLFVFPLFVVASLLIAFLPFGAAAETSRAIADDGREVELQDDGTWQYTSEDRYATTTDGQRILLSPDGSWKPAERVDAELYGVAAKGESSRDIATTDAATVLLDRIVIESVRTTRQKNRMVRSQMIFTFIVRATRQVTLDNLLPGAFTVSDSRTRAYDVVAVRPARPELGPGEQAELLVVADDSPKWWGVRYFEVEIAAGTLGNANPLRLSKLRSEVTEREVDALSTFD